MVFVYVNSSNFISTHYLRSFCLSFLFLAVFFTFVNLFATTTTTTTSNTGYKLSTREFFSQENQTKRSPFSILNVDPKDVENRRYFCSERLYSPRLHQKTFVIDLINLTEPMNSTSAQQSISYDYKLWHSTPLMPRLVSQCEHQLMIKLLKRFDQLTRKYSLPYMIIDGTLLGSWRHFDLIPWDDDLDLLMSIKFKDRLNEAIEIESSSSPFFIEFHHRWDAPKAFEYYKFYFSMSPRFSEYPWRYPFVDLIFYHENETHLWQENLQETTSILKTSIFPLKYRPFGPLWLPSPHSPHDYFLSVGWKNYDDECFNGEWSHKFERTKDFYDEFDRKSMMNCQDLKEFYPFVRRSLNNKEERLIINETVKYILRLNS